MLRTYPDPITETRWRKFLRSNQWASHFVSPEFFLDPRVRDRRPFAILVEDGIEIVACLSGWHERSSTVSGMPTHPQVLIPDSPQRYWVERTLALSLREEAEQDTCIEVHSWSELSAFRELQFWCRQSNSTYVIDLSADENTLFRKFGATKRTSIRSAAKRGLEVREAGVEDVSKFYEVLKATHKRLALGPPLSLDDLLVPETNRRLFIASYDGRCVAGTIVRYNTSGLAEYSENASLPAFWHFHPNDLLLWAGIKWAACVGCTAFNLGGHNVFKKEFGGRLYPVFRLSLDKSFLSLRHRRERLDSLARRLYRDIRTRISGRVHPK